MAAMHWPQTKASLPDFVLQPKNFARHVPPYQVQNPYSLFFSLARPLVPPKILGKGPI